MRGKQAGSTGKVLQVRDGRVLVEGINKVKRHVKPNQALNVPGGIVEVERPIDISNVMLIDPKSGKPTRVKIEVKSDGKRVRIAKKSGVEIN